MALVLILALGAALWAFSQPGGLSGVLGRLGLGQVAGAITGGPALYTLSQSDISAIARNYPDGSNNYTVHDTNATYTLAQAMAAAIQNLQIMCYTGDGYCAGQTRPSGSSVLSAGLASSQVAIAGATQIGDAASTDATGIVGTLGSLSNALPVVGSIIGIFAGVVSFISAAHAKAVALENSILCPLIPAVNQALATARANMVSGAWNGTQVMQDVEEIVTETMQVIAKDPGSGALHAVGEEVQAVRDAFQLIVTRSGI